MNKYQSSKRNLLRLPPFFLLVIGFIFLYALFALNRIKYLFSFKIDGISTTNELWIIPLLCLLILFSKKSKSPKILNKHNLFFTVCILVYIFIIVIGGFHATSIAQYIYAGLHFIIPMFLFFTISHCETEDIEKISKFFVVICLVYSAFAIVLTTNFAFFMNLIGNPTDNYRYYSQYRAPMMLGSSITVSYYFNLSLPLCFYIYYTNHLKKWKVISAVAIIINIIATLVLLSRFAVLCTAIICVYYLFFVRSSSKKYTKKIGFFIFIIIAFVYVYKNYDLTRILEGYNLSGDSAVERLTAGSLGLYIFSKYPLFGSGMGTFFKRVYEDRYITVDGITGLIDPHNLFVLILSELGLCGIIITIILFVSLIKSFSHIHEQVLRRSAYISIAAFLIDSFGGSQMLNEISFSTILWIYMGLFHAVSVRDRMSS